MSESSTSTVTHVGHVDGLRLTLGLCICYTLCVSCLRCYIRWRNYSTDDVIVLSATVLAVTFFGCSYASVSTGLGRPTNSLDLRLSVVEKLNKLALAGNLTWIASLSLSKVAIVAILMHTTQKTSHRRAQYSTALLILGQFVASVALLTASCSSDQDWSWLIRSRNSECPKMLLRWQIITALDIATEAALLFLPMQLVWNLQMTIRNKFIVVSAFWLRIPTIIFSVFRYTKTEHLTTTSDVSLTAAIVVIWQAIQLSYALAAVTIATLRRFTESLNTGFGHGDLIRVHGPSQAYKMSDRSATLKDTQTSATSTTRSKEAATKNASNSALHSKLGGQRSEFEEQSRVPNLRPEILSSTATISSPPNNMPLVNQSIHNGGLGNNIIRQEVQYSIHYDQAPIMTDRQ